MSFISPFLCALKGCVARRSWSSRSVVWLRRCLRFCSLFCIASTRRCSNRLLCCWSAAFLSGPALDSTSTADDSGDFPLLADGARVSASLRTFRLKFPAASFSCSDDCDLNANVFSTSALWVSTKRLCCSVRRSISMRSLTRPFHNSAMRDAAMTSRLVGRTPLQKHDSSRSS